MAKERKNHPSGPPTGQPPLKKRNIQEVLSKVPESWKQMYNERRFRQLNFSYDLKTGLEHDQATQALILKHAKDIEIQDTLYQGYVQTTDLYHPIEDFPVAVTNPFIRILGPDYLYQYSRDRKVRSRNTARRKDFHERETQRLIYLLDDNILDALRLYDPSKPWSTYCTRILGSSAGEESKKYVLPQWKK